MFKLKEVETEFGSNYPAHIQKTLTNWLHLSPTQLRAAIVYSAWDKPYWKQHNAYIIKEGIKDGWENAGVRACFNLPVSFLEDETKFVIANGEYDDEEVVYVPHDEMHSWLQGLGFTGSITQTEMVEWERREGIDLRAEANDDVWYERLALGAEEAEEEYEEHEVKVKDKSKTNKRPRSDDDLPIPMFCESMIEVK